jgi:uncharacterized protein YndB with AHSA1/START domain
MSAETQTLELKIERVLNARADAIYRCWTEPALIVQWFTPRPYETIHAEIDVRPGGGSYIVMRAPDGTEIPNRGVYLEAVPGKRLVFTDAYTAGWVPTAKPFFTGIIELEDLGDGRTRYTARARHWRSEDAEAHAQMGFEPGWNAAADQLEALAATL